jgi:hypothetical protein
MPRFLRQEVGSYCFGSPAIPEGPVPAHRFLHLGQAEISDDRHARKAYRLFTRRRGFPSPDRSGFGFIGNSKAFGSNLDAKLLFLSSIRKESDF